MTNRLLAAGLCAVLFVSAADGLQAADVSKRRMTWAHYVPWIVPTHASMDADRWVNVPVCEKGENPYAEEIRRARDCGIDGFFMDIVCYEKSMAFWDLRPFLKAAEGTDFQFCICLDKRVTPETCIRQIVQMLGAYGNHPNYPKVDERYVVNAYTYLQRPPEEWRTILDGCRKAGFPIYMVANGETFFEPYDDARLEPYAGLFDVLYYFSLTGHGGIPSEQENRMAFEFCRRHGRRFMPCLHPGYFGAWMRGRNDCYQPFRGVDRIFEHFQAAQSFGKDVDWLHVTTWNDHDETTLQPRRLTPADGILLRAFSRAFKGEKPDAGVPEVVFAYHREELPGTVIRIEALRLPSARRGKAVVGGRLRDPDDRIVAELGPQTLDSDWARCEWRVGSAGLSGSAHLVPEVAVKFDGKVRRGTLQPIFLRTPWLEHPETVKTALSFRRNDVRAEWTLAQTGSVLTAGLSFKSPVAVRRAVLYRNDRPLGQFKREPPKAPLLTLAYSGQSFMRLSVSDGRLLSVLKSDDAKGSPNFSWDERKADSKLTQTWMRFTALVEAPPDAKIRLDGCNWRKSVSGTPEEIVRRKALADGVVNLRLSPDGTIRDCPALDCREGSFALSLYARDPAEFDAYWIALECADGTVFETPVRQPHAQGAFASPVVETAVTLETASGASGRPDRREWLKDAPPLPANAVRDVRLACGSRRHAHWSFEGSGVDSSGDRTIADIPEAMYADGFTGRGLKFDGEKSLALPRRLWPVGSWRISVRLKPEAWDGERRVVFGKGGWHEGVTLALDGDGRPEATLSGGGAFTFVASAREPLRTGAWNHVEVLCDTRALRVLVDGTEVARAAVDPVRKYGNLTAYLGAAEKTEMTYRGLLDELDIGCLPITDAGGGTIVVSRAGSVVTNSMDVSGDELRIRARETGLADWVEVSPDFARAEKGEPGYFILPSGDFGTFRADDGELSVSAALMPLWGVKTPRGTVAALVEGMPWDCKLIVRAVRGRYSVSMRFKLGGRIAEEDIVIRFKRLPPTAEYPQMAEWYRNLRISRGEIVPLKERMAGNPDLAYAAKSVEVRIRQAWKPAPPPVKEQTPSNEPPMKVAVTFDHVSEFAHALKAAGVERAEICLVGWNRKGHDGRYPQLFPVEPELGGEEGLCRLIADVQGLGYRIVCHNNHSDAYSVAECWSPEDIVREADGSLSKNACWSGGQMYDLCPRIAWEKYARHDLERIAALGFRGLHYVDVLSIVPPRRCFADAHRLTRREAAVYVNRMLSHGARLMGGIASEGGFDFTAGVLDYALYVSFADPTGALSGLTDRLVPFWQLVYHGIVMSNPFAHTTNYTIKDDRTRLTAVEFGARPAFYVHSKFLEGRAWMGRDDLELDSPGHLAAAVAAVKAGADEYARRSDLQSCFMTNHRLLGKDVAEVCYSDGTRLVVNLSDKPFDDGILTLDARDWVRKP